MTWGWLFVLLAAVTWGTTGTTSKLLAGQVGAGPLVVGSIRLLVASPLLLLAARLGERRLSVPPAPAVAAGVCVAAYQLCFFSAVPRAGVAATALLAICSAPLMIAVAAAAFLGEKLTARVGVALVVGVGGTALLVGGANGSASQFAAGALLALGAGLSYALYVVVTKAALSRAEPVAMAAATFTVGALILLPVLVLQAPSPRGLAAGAPLFLYLGAVPTALAYVLYTRGLRHTSATAAGLAALLEPLTATILGVVLFAERLGPVGILGAVMLLGALSLVTLSGRMAPAGMG